MESIHKILRTMLWLSMCMQVIFGAKETKKGLESVLIITKVKLEKRTISTQAKAKLWSKNNTLWKKLEEKLHDNEKMKNAFPVKEEEKEYSLVKMSNQFFLEPFEKRPRWVQWWFFQELSISPTITKLILSYLKLKRVNTKLCEHFGENNRSVSHPVALLSPDEHWFLSMYFPDAFTGLRFPADAHDNPIYFSDAYTGECVQTFRSPSDKIYDCAIATTNMFVVIACDKEVHLWDTLSGNLEKKFIGHGRNVTACRIYAQNTRVVSTSADFTARVWDVETGQCLAVLCGHTDRISSCVAFASMIVTSGCDNTLRV